MFAYEQAENDFMTRWDSGVHKDSVIGTNFDPMHRIKVSTNN